MIRISKTNNEKIIISSIMITCIILSSILTFSFSVLLIQLFLGLTTIFIINKKDEKSIKIYMYIFIISMIFVFVVYIANNMAYNTPYYVGGSDDLMFEYKGRLVADSNIFNPKKLLGNILDMFDNSPFFAVYMAVLIKFSNLFDGYSTFLPRIINVYFLLWTCMILEYLLKNCLDFSDKKARITILLFALTPNIQYINAHIFRDTLNLFEMLMIIYVFEKLIRSNRYFIKIPYIFLLIFLIYVTYYTRQSSILFASIISLLLLFKKYKINKLYAILLMIIVLLKSGILDTLNLSYFISYYSEYTAELVGDGLSSYIFRAPLLPWGIILRALYAFIIPFPNFFVLFKDGNKILLDIIMVFIYFGVLIQILFIPFIFKRTIKFDTLSLIFLITFVAVIGTTFTFRHVILYYPFMVALGVDQYLTSNKKTRKNILFFSLCYAILLAILYLIFKIM